MNGLQLRAMLCGSFLFTSVGLAQADPPASIKVGEKYTETQMEKLVSYKVEEGLTIFVKTEYGHLNYGKPVNNDLFLISEISAPPRKSLGEAIGMVRLQTGQVAYLKTVDCEYFEKNMKNAGIAKVEIVSNNEYVGVAIVNKLIPYSPIILV